MVERDFPGSFKVSIELEGEKKLSGDDLFALLDQVERTGSISRAASHVGVSYRYAWGLLQKAEDALGLKLVDKQAGGTAGGGTFLTREGRDLLMQYRAFRSEIIGQMQRYLPAAGSEEGQPEFRGKEVDSEESGKMQQAEEIRNSKDSRAPEEYRGHQESHLILASTMEPVETGLLDVLEQAFYHHSGILVRHIAAGSGRALEIGRAGRADMVLSHAPELEDQFMQDGWGALKIHIMSNHFVLVGPALDPAGIGFLACKGNDSSDVGEVVQAFQKIAGEKAAFVSRGDRSGTHLRELQIWSSAGIEPEGGWYVQSTGLVGNLGILRLAQEKQAYTLVDRASYILSRLALSVFLQRDDQKESHPELTNRFSLILVNPEQVPSVRFEEALKFARWLQGNKARRIIQHFGLENFNTPLFSTSL